MNAADLSFVERLSSLGGSKCIVGIILGPYIMSFIERVIILYSHLEEPTIRGSTVLVIRGTYYIRTDLICTIQECVLSMSMYYPGVRTIQGCVLSRSMYYPGVCTIQECVLSRSVYYPGVCTIQECVLSRGMYYPGVCTIQECVLSRGMYYPGVCAIQEYVLSRSVY